MIAELTTDLLTRLKTITGDPFGAAPNQRVGLVIGGKDIDPMMSKITHPAAWVVYVGDSNNDQMDQGTCGGVPIIARFIVKIIIDYKNEQDLLTNQLPLLEKVIASINGQQPTQFGKRWKYEGQTVDEIDSNRLIYDQRYSVVTMIA